MIDIPLKAVQILDSGADAAEGFMVLCHF